MIAQSPTPRRLLAAPAVALTLALAACGSDSEEFDPIPSGRAQALLTQLDQVESEFEKGNCGSAGFQVGELEEKVERLPDGIDPQVRETLRDGLRRLQTLVDRDCDRLETDTEPEQTETETTPEPTTPEPTTPEPTTPEPTTPEPTTPEPTIPEPTPPDGDGDGGTGAPGGGTGGGVPPEDD